MKTLIQILVSLIVSAFMLSCDNQPSLQEYFVNKAGSSDFISFDVPASILKINEDELTPEQKETLGSLKKLNVLALKLDEKNKDQFEAEKKNISDILSSDKYQELMRINSGTTKGVVKYLGDDDAIDEVIIFGNDSRYGLALIRVLGNNMKAENVAEYVALLQKSNLDKNGLGQLGSMFNGQ